MPSEALPAPAEQPEQEVPREELPSAGKSRRKFLQAAGAIAGGAFISEETVARIAVEALRVKEFTWSKLEQEVADLQDRLEERWKTEARSRIREGIDRYMSFALKEYEREERSAKNNAEDAHGRKDRRSFFRTFIPPGTAEGAEIGMALFLKNHLGKITSGEESFRSLDATNQTIIFGGAGAGIGLLLDGLDAIKREKDPQGALEKFKTITENQALNAIIEANDEPKGKKEITIKKPREEVTLVSAEFDDLIQAVAHNIIQNGRYLSKNIKPDSMLTYWGAGVAMTQLPTTPIMLQRELEAKLIGRQTNA